MNLTPKQRKRANRLLKDLKRERGEILDELARIYELQSSLGRSLDLTVAKRAICRDILFGEWKSAWPDWFVEAMEKNDER